MPTETDQSPCSRELSKQMRSQISVSSSRKSSSSPFPFHLLIYESVFSSKQTSRCPSLNVHQQGSAAAGLGCWAAGKMAASYQVAFIAFPRRVTQPLILFDYFSSSSSEHQPWIPQLDSAGIHSIEVDLIISSFCIWRHLLFYFTAAAAFDSNHLVGHVKKQIICPMFMSRQYYRA